MTSSLVGSEMCIRDRPTASLTTALLVPVAAFGRLVIGVKKWEAPESVSYTHLTLPTICSV
eukprot:10664852-Prorocentrum_lima.AAC.1